MSVRRVCRGCGCCIVSRVSKDLVEDGKDGGCRTRRRRWNNVGCGAVVGRLARVGRTLQGKAAVGAGVRVACQPRLDTLAVKGVLAR